MAESLSTPQREGKKKAERCKMVTYGGFFIMAGPAPKGVKPERCPLPPLDNGFCEKHNPENW
jgi:hypothetical protein